MKILCHLVCVGIWGLVSLAYAASVPFADYGQQTELSAEPVEIPQPASLEANWWRFFEVGGEELEQRIQKAIEALKPLPTKLASERTVAARQFIERIESNLQALPQARSQPTPTPPPLLGYAENYTVSQLLDIAGRLSQLQAQLQAERDEVASVEGAIKAAHQRIDTQLAAYLALSPANPERVVRGLEIMADRSALALTEEQLRVRKGSLQVQEVRLQQLTDEQTVAAQRLFAEKADLTRLTSEIQQTQSELIQAEDLLTNAQARAAQARASSIVSNDPEDQATALYRQQQALQAAVAKAIIEMRLLKLQAEHQLVSLLLDISSLDTQVLRQRLSALDTRLAKIREQATGWTRDSERERSRAGEAMALLSAEEGAGALTFVKLLNQERLNLAQETLVALQRLDEVMAQASLLIEQVQVQLAHKEGAWRDWLARIGHILERLWERSTELANRSLFKIESTPVTALGLLWMVFILFLAWLLSYWLRHALRKLGQSREQISQSAIYTVSRLSHYVIIGLGFMIGLSSIGIDLTNFAVVAGAIGIGIGFGLQSIVNNFVSGLILFFERSLKVGDFVELASGVTGEVREINVRSTRINTNDNVDVMVPNSQFINHDVTNWTLQEPHRRIHIPFKVAHGSDKDLVKQAALEAADRIEHTLKFKKPSIWLVDFEDIGLLFELVVWVNPTAVKKPGSVSSAYRWEIETALRKHGIEIRVLNTLMSKKIASVE